MVPKRCLSRTSLGITRGFPRLYPITGLVAVALLTLAPLALRPVRLACLIHAANVHSEPGSNPSKVFVTRPKTPHASPRKVEEMLTGRTEGTSPKGVPSAAGFKRPPSSPISGTTPISTTRLACRRLPSRVHNQRDCFARSTELSKIPPRPPTLSAGATRSLFPRQVTPAVISDRVVSATGESDLKLERPRFQEASGVF